MAEFCTSDVRVAGRKGAERVIRVVGDIGHGLDEAVKRPLGQSVYLFQCLIAQFGPVGQRRLLAAAIRSFQSGITSVTGTVVAVPERMAASSS